MEGIDGTQQRIADVAGEILNARSRGIKSMSPTTARASVSARPPIRRAARSTSTRPSSLLTGGLLAGSAGGGLLAGSAGGSDFEGNGHGDIRVQPYGHLVGAGGLDGPTEVDGPLVQQGPTG